MQGVVGRHISCSFRHSGHIVGTYSIVGWCVKFVWTQIRWICEGEGVMESSGRCLGLLGSLLGCVSIWSSRSLWRWRYSGGHVQRTSFYSFTVGCAMYSGVVIVLIELICVMCVARLFGDCQIFVLLIGSWCTSGTKGELNIGSSLDVCAWAGVQRRSRI